MMAKMFNKFSINTKGYMLLRHYVLYLFLFFFFFFTCSVEIYSLLNIVILQNKTKKHKTFEWQEKVYHSSITWPCKLTIFLNLEHMDIWDQSNDNQTHIPYQLIYDIHTFYFYAQNFYIRMLKNI